jgi:hypothetical protein
LNATSAIQTSVAASAIKFEEENHESSHSDPGCKGNLRARSCSQLIEFASSFGSGIVRIDAANGDMAPLISVG